MRKGIFDCDSHSHTRLIGSGSRSRYRCNCSLMRKIQICSRMKFSALAENNNSSVAAAARSLWGQFARVVLENNPFPIGFTGIKIYDCVTATPRNRYIENMIYNCPLSFIISLFYILTPYTTSPRYKLFSLAWPLRFSKKMRCGSGIFRKLAISTFLACSTRFPD